MHWLDSYVLEMVGPDANVSSVFAVKTALKQR